MVFLCNTKKKKIHSRWQKLDAPSNSARTGVYHQVAANIKLKGSWLSVRIARVVGVYIGSVWDSAVFYLFGPMSFS